MMLRLLKLLFKARSNSTMQPAVENPAGVVVLTEAVTDDHFAEAGETEA